MNCVQPSAPADDGPMLQPRPDSIVVMAASTFQFSPKALAAAFHVGSSGPLPEHGAAAASPERYEGAYFSARLAVEASEASGRTLTVRTTKTSTQDAARPAFDGACI